MKLTGIVQRPIYGKTQDKVFGRVMGTLSIDGFSQISLLRRILHDAMRTYAGRDEETLLAKLDRDLASMERRAVREQWAGWFTAAGRRALATKEDGDE